MEPFVSKRYFLYFNSTFCTEIPNLFGNFWNSNFCLRETFVFYHVRLESASILYILFNHHSAENLSASLQHPGNENIGIKSSREDCASMPISLLCNVRPFYNNSRENSWNLWVKDSHMHAALFMSASDAAIMSSNNVNPSEVAIMTTLWVDSDVVW